MHRWWHYYICVIAAGSIGSALGAWAHYKFPADSRRFQQILMLVFFVCGVFFIAATPSSDAGQRRADAIMGVVP